MNGSGRQLRIQARTSRDLSLPHKLYREHGYPYFRQGNAGSGQKKAPVFKGGKNRGQTFTRLGDTG